MSQPTGPIDVVFIIIQKQELAETLGYCVRVFDTLAFQLFTIKISDRLNSIP